jgi:hypothetical protein
MIVSSIGSALIAAATVKIRSVLSTRGSCADAGARPRHHPAGGSPSCLYSMTGRAPPRAPSCGAVCNGRLGRPLGRNRHGAPVCLFIYLFIYLNRRQVIKRIPHKHNTHQILHHLRKLGEEPKCACLVIFRRRRRDGLDGPGVVPS